MGSNACNILKRRCNHNDEQKKSKPNGYFLCNTKFSDYLHIEFRSRIYSYSYIKIFGLFSKRSLETFPYITEISRVNTTMNPYNNTVWLKLFIS